ncbi:MAG: hypothetical protein AAGC78_21130 [Cellvibrio sp.]|uniref:hypothetical protein n=1 Tax=Cellvibrio sp. TaxID=1965322 RepID=UPI0031A1D47F
MRRPLILIIILIISFSQSEISSPNALNSVIYPLLFVSALLLLIIILARSFTNKRKSNLEVNDGGDAYYLSGKNGGDSGDGGGD